MTDRKKNPNPLQRTSPLVHLPLVVLAAMFMVPLVWLIMTSLQPREQIGRMPPEWLPRKSYLVVAGEEIPVVPPEAVGADKLVVVPDEGPEKGKALLVEPADFESGMVRRRV